MVLAPWIAWLRGRSVPLGFSRAQSHRGAPPMVLTFDGAGVVATVRSTTELPFWVQEVKAIPPGALARVDFEPADQRMSNEWRAAWEAAAGRT